MTDQNGDITKCNHSGASHETTSSGFGDPSASTSAKATTPTTTTPEPTESSQACTAAVLDCSLKFRAYMEGTQSVNRIGKALLSHFGEKFSLYQRRQDVFSAIDDAVAKGGEHKENRIGTPLVHFLWENTPKKFNKAFRESSLAYNHLDNASIFEDKTSLARLQELMPCPTLKSFVVKDRNEFLTLAPKILAAMPGKPDLLDRASVTCSGSTTGDISTPENRIRAPVWVVKDPLANSAEGVWFFTAHNYQQLAMNLQPPIGGQEASMKHRKTGYAIQQFISNPALYNGRKYHIRTYNLITGDLSAFIHKSAFLHVANKPYSLAAESLAPERDSSTPGVAFDGEIFLTNCCTNKSSEEFAGEICIDLDSEEWDPVFKRMQAKFGLLVETATPFLKNQRSASHFEFMGVDWMVDSHGEVWLIECNCPPCVETATGLQAAEDLHDEVALDIVRLMVEPSIVGCRHPESGTAADTGHSSSMLASSTEGATRVAPVDTRKSTTRFSCCKSGRPEFVPSPALKLALNCFAWSKFVRSLQQQ